MPGLRKAHCDGERISNISPAAVACLAGVESLYLQRNRLQGLRELAGLTGLRFLTLAHNRLTVVRHRDYCCDFELQKAAGAWIVGQFDRAALPDIAALQAALVE